MRREAQALGGAVQQPAAGVARTLADLDGGVAVTRVHIAEALSYRRIVPGGTALAAKA